MLPFLASAPAQAAPADRAANQVADRVMDPDKLYSNFLVAEKRLNAALKKCGRNACSKGVRARLYRDLGVVYVVGLRRLDKGKEMLEKAVEADPSIELDQRIATPELEQLFREAGGGSRSRFEPSAEPEEEEEEAEEEEEEEEEEPTETEEPETGSLDQGEEVSPFDDKPRPKKKRARGKKTFISLGFQQDFLYFPGDTGVCAAGIDIYDCFDYRGSEYEGPIYNGAGNEVRSGLGFATTRLLLGYDRQVGSNALIGVRLGYAFGGGPTPLSGEGFLPWHAEVRAGIFFGNRPFSRRSVRPNLSLGAGLAELTSHVAVDYWETERDYDNEVPEGTLDTWRRSGKLFVAPGFGLMIPVTTNGSLTFDVRGMFMFGKSAIGAAAGLGYAIGI